MKRALAVVAVIALLPLLAACRQPPPNLDSPGRSIVCFGDSITAGVGAGPGRTYPDFLAARLRRSVVNAGVSGDTAADGLARLSDVLAEDPWLVIVELGGNDLLRQVPIEKTESDLRAIVERLLKARVLPVLVEVHGPFGGRHRDLYERLGREYRTPIVEDVLSNILRDPALKSDEIHPNARGYEKLAAAVAETVEPLVAARRRVRP
ncbi:MAG TPA: GDSL-type esterase/lipase family protein [Thermoanaerobaculia bacterium]|nr:GDSL-type esterase/lipase family protein [Thermoanaerobaculia bacterium]